MEITLKAGRQKNYRLPRSNLPFKQRVAGSNPARLTFRPRRLVWPRTPAFHAGDTGSNPVGDANSPLNTQHASKIFLLQRNSINAEASREEAFGSPALATRSARTSFFSNGLPATVESRPLVSC